MFFDGIILKMKVIYMNDGLFLINSALNINKNLSVFPYEKRKEQLIETIDSINSKCPNNIKIIMEGSPYPIEKEYIEYLMNTKNCIFFFTGEHPYVKQFSLQGLRSHAECVSWFLFFSWFNEEKQKEFNSKRFYKLSGRYTLTENFKKEEAEKHVGKFVFAEKFKSWLPKEKQESADVDYLYKLRFWHMDYELIPLLSMEMKNILDTCMKHGVDIEHCFYKHLHDKNVHEEKMIGVEGYVAPTGEYINE